MKNIKKFLKYKILYGMVKYGKGMSDENYLKVYYKIRTGKRLDLKKPKSFNEKINWIKLNERDKVMNICADKFLARKFVGDRIGEEYLVPLLWAGEKTEDIPFEKFPNAYVLKTNNSSGTNILVKDKSTINKDLIRNKLNQWLKENYYYPKREWVYKDIKPMIICEEFLVQENDEELKDYRFFCFNGEPKFISVDFNINDKSSARRNLYDLNWNLLDAEISYPKELSLKVEKPEKLEKMIELSKILSKNFPHVRIDFYYVNKHIFFGEMTFYHQSGMGEIRPVEFDNTMGDWLKLPI